MKLLLLCCSLSLSAAAADSTWSQRLAAARQQALQARTKLGLEKNEAKLYGAYPTPEITFDSNPETRLGLCPGKTAVVQLPGKFAAGSQVFVHSDDIKVLKEKLTPSGWEATVQAAANAPPQRVLVSVAAPVSFAQRTDHLFDVACGYHWKVSLSDGTTLAFATDLKPASPRQVVTVEWARAGKKAAVPMDVDALEDHGVELRRQVSEDEQTATTDALQKVLDSDAMKALNARSEKTGAAMEACGKKPIEQLGKCLEAPQKELMAIGEEQGKLLADARKALVPKAGCDEVVLVPAAGTLTGDATHCVDHPEDERLQLKGTYSSP